LVSLISSVEWLLELTGFNLAALLVLYGVVVLGFLSSLGRSHEGL
jgi:hypothetical protein